MDPLEQICADCGETFLVVPAEQQFYREHNMTPPALCPSCGARRRTERNADLISAHTSDDFGLAATVLGTARLHGAGNGYGGTGGRQTYPATCASCGAQTRVPFIPRGDRPVFCRDCYQARRGR
jgi:CxxC-x17-CxxC domain-containing protein